MGRPRWSTSCPDLTTAVDFAIEPNGADGEFLPYLRDPETLARAVGDPGHRGDAAPRSAGWRRPTRPATSPTTRPTTTSWSAPGRPRSTGSPPRLPPTEVDDPDGDATVAVIGWGSTYGPIGAACRRIRRSGRSIAQIHLRHLNPLPADLGDILRRYDRVVCPEMNLGQLALLLRGKYLVDIESHTQVRGLPFRAAELAAVIQEVIDRTATPVAATANGEFL